MSRVEIKCFFSDNKQSNDAREMLKVVETEYGNKIEIISLSPEDQLYQEYSLTATPAIVIEEMIKFVGFCPSKETFISAILSFE